MAQSKRRKYRPLTRAQTLAVLEIVFEYRSGFCLALRRLQTAGLITGRMYGGLWDELRRIAPMPHAGYWWPKVRVERDVPRLTAVRQLQRKRRRTR